MLGCGAQKSGTTWVSHNLRQSEEFWDGGLKEWRLLRYFGDQKSLAKKVASLEEAQPNFKTGFQANCRPKGTRKIHRQCHCSNSLQVTQ